MNTTKRQIELLSLQNLATLAFIGSLIISVYLTEDEKKDLLYNTNHHQSKKIQNLNTFNRILVVVLALIYLYVSLENEKIAKIKNLDLKNYKLQDYASILSLIGAGIALFSISTNPQNGVSNVENPDL